MTAARTSAICIFTFVAIRTGDVLRPGFRFVKFTLLREVRLRKADLAEVPREERFCDVLLRVRADPDLVPCEERFREARCCDVLGCVLCIGIISNPFLPTDFGTIYPVLYH